jgi:hypothetical protein
MTLAWCVLTLASAGCASKRAPVTETVDAALSAVASGSASASPLASSAPAAGASASQTAPVASVALERPPDVRVEIPRATKGAVTLKAEVKVGQTFGVLLPTVAPEDWLDQWEVESCTMVERKPPKCPLGEPVTIIGREPDLTLPHSDPPSRPFEVMWKIAPTKVGTHRLEARYIHRTMRTDPGRPTRHVMIEVSVGP